jgi:autotransporter-associated beta strand protein
VTVQIQDAAGNLTSSTANVAMAIGTNPGSGTLSGTTSVAAVAGVATFSTLSIDKVGTGYTLSASSGVLTPATTNTFNITAGAPAKLAVIAQPTTTVAGVAISPAVTVQIQDAAGNLTTSTAGVTMAIGTNPGSSTLSGTLTVNGANSYNGVTQITGGTLKLGNALALGSTAAGTTLSSPLFSGGTIDLNGQAVVDETLSMDGTTTDAVYFGVALVNSSQTAASWSGGITLAGGTSGIGGAGDITITGSITGGGGLRKVGADTVTLTAAANTGAGAMP